MILQKKKIKDCKIYSPFSHYKGNGFEFRRLVWPKKDYTVSVSLFDNNKKIKTTFIHSFKEINYYANIIYRDRPDSLTGKWFGTSKNLFHEAAYYATKMKTTFKVRNFGGNFYEVQKKGTGYVTRTLNEWRKLVPKGLGHLMPFIVCRTSSCHIDVSITRNIIFLTPPTGFRGPTREGMLKNCKYLGDFQLDEADAK